MASAELSRRVEKAVAYPPLFEMAAPQGRELHEALLDADSFEDLSGQRQAAILQAEENRPRICGSCRTRSPRPPKRVDQPYGFEGFRVIPIERNRRCR